MKSMHISLIFLICISLFIVACTKEGDELIGYWKTPKLNLATIEIVHNNNGFVVIRNFSNPISGKIIASKIPAQFNNGVLTIVNGIETIHMSVDKTSGKLLYKSLEFEKISKNEFDALAKKVQEKNKSIDEEEAKPKSPHKNSSW